MQDLLKPFLIASQAHEAEPSAKYAIKLESPGDSTSIRGLIGQNN